MFGPIGMPELILIFVVALLVFGPKKLPELGKSLGKGLAEFRKASDELKKTIEDEIENGKRETATVRQGVAEATQLISPPESVPRTEVAAASEPGPPAPEQRPTTPV
jgi:sec-independent protein translocase protein TatA